jgi:hypothetical protein
MSSEADRTVYDTSVEGQDNVNLFEAKKWTYITDSSSANGQFNGQIQFDLNTLSSQNQWTSLSEAVITFPVKLTIKNGSTATAPAAMTINSATIKNGFHQFVDSLQIVIGGTTVQSSQIFTNIDTNYKILTEWSQDTLNKYGAALGVSLDDVDIAYTDSSAGATESLDNTGLITVNKGFDVSDFVLNTGFKRRLNTFNNSTASTLGRSILTTNQAVLGKSNVQVATVATANADNFVLYALGTIRLKDVSDAIAKMPLVKGLKGFIYLNYNSSTHTLAGSTTVLSAAPVDRAVYGRCCPAQLNLGSDGFSLGNTTDPVFTADISATASASLTTATPIQTNAILHAPYYVATPEVDRSLTTRKTIRYNERFVSQFNMSASGSFNGTLTPGISNPKRVILYPYFTGAGASGNSGFLTNPLLSCFDGTPSTTSPFAAIKDLQVYVGNVPMYQSPVSQDWQTFLNEVSSLGDNGGEVDQASSGLLSSRTWNQLYRYYTVDIGRRMNSEDGASKSIQLSCTNATTCPMTVVAIIWYEREVTIDTASGMVMQSM